MIQRLYPFLCIFLLFFLQLFFHSLFGRVAALPDLVPIAIAVAAVRWGVGGVALVGFIAGLIEDSFSTSHLGLNSLSWVGAATSGALIKGSLYGNRLAVAVILVAFLKVIHDVIYYVIYLWGMPGDIFTQLFFFTPLSVVYSAGLALVTFLLFQRQLLE